VTSAFNDAFCNKLKSEVVYVNVEKRINCNKLLSARLFSMELNLAASKSWENSKAPNEGEKPCTPPRFRSFLGMKQMLFEKLRNQPAARASFGRLHYRDTSSGRPTVRFLFHPTTEKPSKMSVGVSVWNGVFCESLPMSTRFWNPL